MPIPFVAYAIGAGAAALFTYIGNKNKWWQKNQSKITLSLIGTSQSGKTELFYRLKGIDRPHHRPTTIIDEDDSFYLLDGKKKLKINKILDYPGSKDGIRAYFDEAISNGTHFFLIFDINKVLSKNNEEIGFFKFVLKKMGYGKNIIFIGSFLDKVKDENYIMNVNKILSESLDSFKPNHDIMFGSLLDDKFISEIKKKILPE